MYSLYLPWLRSLYLLWLYSLYSLWLYSLYSLWLQARSEGGEPLRGPASVAHGQLSAAALALLKVSSE